MSTNNKLAALAAGFAILVGSMAGSTAEARPHHRYIVKKPHYREMRVASGTVWRHRIGKGWDNTCHNLPYLINMYACSPK
jgi:hypothetical protein